MQIKELSSKGLKREYSVTVSAGDLATLLKKRLEEIGKHAKIAGFRPGKVPLTILEQRYKGSALKEVLEDCLTKAPKEIVKQFKINPALRPTVSITSYEDGKDLVAQVDAEILPTIEDIQVEGLSFENYVVDVPEKEVDDALAMLTKPYRKTKSLEKARKLKAGDVAIIDFEGSIDKEPIAGGSGTDYHLEIGSGSFIPGFEDQLIGAAKGDKVDVKVQFPKEYHDPQCAEKKAVFKVTLKDIQEYEPLVLDDAFAAELNFGTAKDMRDAVRARIVDDYASQSALNTKRNVLDALSDKFSFEVPEGLVDFEFNSIWAQLLRELRLDPKAPHFAKEFEKAAEKPEDELRESYRNVAERRVRLGILIAEIGKRHEIKVTTQELTDALMAKAREFPGQEREVFEYFRTNEDALATLRAPIFEQKVVDFILEKSKVKETKLSPEDFAKALAREEEEAEKKIFSQKKTKKK